MIISNETNITIGKKQKKINSLAINDLGIFELTPRLEPDKILFNLFNCDGILNNFEDFIAICISAHQSPSFKSQLFVEWVRNIAIPAMFDRYRIIRSDKFDNIVESVYRVDQEENPDKIIKIKFKSYPNGKVTFNIKQLVKDIKPEYIETMDNSIEYVDIFDANEIILNLHLELRVHTDIIKSMSKIMENTIIYSNYVPNWGVNIENLKDPTSNRPNDFENEEEVPF